jgi:hypothetical protein
MAPLIARCSASGSHLAERVTLTSKGLALMNAVPAGLKQSVGAELKKATEQGSSLDFGKVGDLIWGIFGGLAKSIGGG